MFLYSAEFKKRYKKLPRSAKEKTIARLELLAQDEFAPLLNNHPLRGKYEAYRSINITGDIRLVYRKPEPGTYFLVTIGTHSQLYE